jgi:hypothetical protein
MQLNAEAALFFLAILDIIPCSPKLDANQATHLALNSCMAVFPINIQDKNCMEVSIFSNDGECKIKFSIGAKVAGET